MKKVVFCFCLLSLFGCKKESLYDFDFAAPVFKDTVEINGRVLNDSIITHFIRDLAIYKEYLITEATTKDDKMLNLYDRNTGEFIKSFVNIGRGPGEVNSLGRMTVNHKTGDLWAADLVRRQAFRYNLDSVTKETPDYFEQIVMKGYDEHTLGNISPCEGGLFMVMNSSIMYRSPRYMKMDLSGTVTHTYDDYPRVKGDELDTMRHHYTLIPNRGATSPDGKKYIVIADYGGLFEIFDIATDICLKKRQGFYEPAYDMKAVKSNNFDYYNIQPNDKTVSVIGDIYATDNYIYMRFGEYGKNVCNDSRQNIGVFDWDGNAVRLYKTDYIIGMLCVDEADKKLYAVTSEDILIEFDL